MPAGALEILAPGSPAGPDSHAARDPRDTIRVFGRFGRRDGAAGRVGGQMSRADADRPPPQAEPDMFELTIGASVVYGGGADLEPDGDLLDREPFPVPVQSL